MRKGFALYLQGSTPTQTEQAPCPATGSCVGGNLVRCESKQNVGGASSVPGPGDGAISALGVVQFPGVHVYQAY